jgi:hypothetical protein
VRSELVSGDLARVPEWSTAVAVGRRAFAEQVQRDLGVRGRYRRIEEANGAAILRDAESSYAPRLTTEMPCSSAETAGN